MHAAYNRSSGVLNSVDSWRSLFFYLYTGVIQFAPLRSQGVNMRTQYIQERTTPDKPPPCSPKVIYSLAVAVGHSLVFLIFPRSLNFCIQLEVNTLRDLAFYNIQSKLTPENVVAELFSGFTCW